MTAPGHGKKGARMVSLTLLSNQESAARSITRVAIGLFSSAAGRFIPIILMTGAVKLRGMEGETIEFAIGAIGGGWSVRVGRSGCQG